jgi:hypothetical protein
MIISGITWAVLVDSGWYEVEDPGETNPWGKGRGCDFLNKPCTPEQLMQTYSEFCVKSSMILPDFFYRGKS